MRDPSGQGYRLLEAVKGVQLTQRRNVVRTATVGSSILCLLILSFFFFYEDGTAARRAAWDLPADLDPADVIPRTKIALCDDFDKRSLPRLLAAEKRYQDLMENKFTVVIQTYKRPEVLNQTLHSIIEGETKLLDQIIVVWNDLETKVPDDWMSPGGIPIHFMQSEVNSLNQKLKPYAAIKTQAVLLGDDDTYYTKADLEFAFQTWRETGRSRLVGAWPRAGRFKKGKMEYHIPRQAMDYNMILTGLSFVHIAFLDYYSSSDALMTKIRGYVDERFNCEDIAMNYMTQSITGCPPLWVKGKDGARMTPKPEGMPTIGKSKSHGAKRAACLNDFNQFFGRNPLKLQAGFLIRGELQAP